ncbi:MAG: glutamate 5-kinase [Lachnospiraceae bacterium]|nr:glutamate 5-kinase [Lachnospiraceae bacterium]
MALYHNRIVVKIGTSTIMNETGRTDLRNVERLVRVLADVSGMGYEVIIVSSGAIAVGANKLMLPSRPDDLSVKLAAAAVGQCSLLHLYDKIFEEYDKVVAQVLMSAEDAGDPESRTNLTTTFDTLLQLGVIPIVNENDSVRSTEIESKEQVFGDNDMLSAVVADLTRASRLVILSDTDGTEVKGSRRGAAGLATKQAAARKAAEQGIGTYIIKGKGPERIYDVIEGKADRLQIG